MTDASRCRAEGLIGLGATGWDRGHRWFRFGELVMRNCIVAGNQNDVSAVIAGAATTIRYSTIENTCLFSTSSTIGCGDNITITDSIIFNRGSVGSTLSTSCTGANVVMSHNAADETLPGTTNQLRPEMPTNFVDINTANLFLTAEGAAVGAYGDVAQWDADTDPPTDIEGNPRPNTDGAADVAGAHLGP